MRWFSKSLLLLSFLYGLYGEVLLPVGDLSDFFGGFFPSLSKRSLAFSSNNSFSLFFYSLNFESNLNCLLSLFLCSALFTASSISFFYLIFFTSSASFLSLSSYSFYFLSFASFSFLAFSLSFRSRSFSRRLLSFLSTRRRSRSLSFLLASSFRFKILAFSRFACSAFCCFCSCLRFCCFSFSSFCWRRLYSAF